MVRKSQGSYRASELNVQVHLVVECHHGVIRSGGGHFGTRFCLEENLPSVRWRLQLVEIERREVVHKETFNLATEDVDLGAEDVERMAVSPRRTRACG